MAGVLLRDGPSGLMPDSFQYPQDSLDLRSIPQWVVWLEANHAKSNGIWLILAKKSTGMGLDYQEVLESAICYGWIDAIRKSATSSTYLQRFTPRGRRSIWSKINCDKAMALIESGRMQSAGLAEIDRAKQDGRWARAYDGQRSMQIPGDLAAAFQKNKRARAFFETLDSRNRYAVLFRLHTAKKQETRAKRLAAFIEMLELGRTLHPISSRSSNESTPR